MKLARNITVLEYVAGTLVGVGIALLALGLGLVARWEAVRLYGIIFEARVRPGAPDWVTIAIGALACAVFATAVSRLREMLHLDVSPRPGGADAWSAAAKAYGLPRALAGVALAALFLLGMGVVAWGLVSGNALALSLRLVVVVLLYALTVWLLVRPPRALTAFGHRIDRLLRRGQPTYTLTPEGVAISLHRARRGRPGSTPVLLRYDELTEVRALSYVTAKAYVRYEVGPNLTLALRQTEDVARFFRGDLPRPRVYTMGTPTMAGKHVLLRGTELFYLVAFDCDDAADLVSAFEAARAGSVPLTA